MKFEGFETLKLNLRKVRILNNSTRQQRVHIIPPGTPFFNINVKKRGNLAPGMSEEVTIHFTPNEYRY